MEFKLGLVAKIKAGHDAGKFCVVVGEEQGFLYVADGRRRPLARPKKKNLRHLAPTTTVLEQEAYSTDKRLRESLKPFEEAVAKPTNH